MDEKQKKQIEIVKSALSEEKAAVVFIYEEIVGLAKKILNDVTAFEVLQGNSEIMLAASALMSLAQQVEQIIPDSNE